MTAKIEPGLFRIAAADNEVIILTVGDDHQVKAKINVESSWELERAGSENWVLIYRDQSNQKSDRDGWALHLDKDENHSEIHVRQRDGSENQLWKLIPKGGEKYSVSSCLGDGRLIMGIQYMNTGGGPGPVVLGGYSVIALDVEPVSKNSTREWVFNPFVL